jgi:hypothetical protein
LSFGYSWIIVKHYNILYVSSNKYGKGGKRQTVLLHRYLTDCPKGIFIDHKDGDGLNNRRSNFREVTNAENGQNRNNYAKNSTGFRGVTYNKRDNRYKAQLQVNGKSMYLGYYADFELAKSIVIEARKKHMPFSTETYRIEK